MKKLSIHHISILANLAFRESARFTDLNTQGMPSYQFNYYLKNLIETKYIFKNNEGSYELTTKGKVFVSRIDVQNNTILEQSHLHALVVCRQISENYENYLCLMRLKHPFYKWTGFPSFRLQIGVNYTEQVANYLLQIGLSGEIRYFCTKHVLVQVEDSGQTIDDKLFLVFEVTNITGDLLEENTKGSLIWLNQDALLALPHQFLNVGKIIEELSSGEIKPFEDTIEIYKKI